MATRKSLITKLELSTLKSGDALTQGKLLTPDQLVNHFNNQEITLKIANDEVN